MWASDAEKPELLQPCPATRRPSRRAGFPSQSRADLVGARALSRGRDRRRAGSRQRHRPARGRIRPPVAAPDLVAGGLRSQHLQSIEAWRTHSAFPTSGRARFIDLSAPDWGLNADDSTALTDLTAIFCANVIHIAPWPVAEGLLTNAAAACGADGKLFLYGPFKRDGAHTAPSNEAFDQSLQSRDPAWGVRDIADIEIARGRRRIIARRASCRCRPTT